ncbi:hypothetical protein BD408DRAFT_420336 [Parasitella parasitica]|nr:hypothetical protein BD408DRAFT_420336 [Parasitella parasitica]
MSTLILEKYDDDMILYPNDDQESFSSDPPFSLVAELSSNGIFPNECHSPDFSSEEDDDMPHHPHAPPPSPQAKPILDILVSEKLNASLGTYLVENDRLENNTAATETSIYSNHLEKHAQTLDALLRKTVEGRTFKRNFKRSSLRMCSTTSSSKQLLKKIVENELCRKLERSEIVE